MHRTVSAHGAGRTKRRKEITCVLVIARGLERALPNGKGVQGHIFWRVVFEFLLDGVQATSGKIVLPLVPGAPEQPQGANNQPVPVWELPCGASSPSATSLTGFKKPHCFMITGNAIANSLSPTGMSRKSSRDSVRCARVSAM